MPWFPLKGDARITGRCASEGCPGQPTWRLEASGVGSIYCSGCMDQIEKDPHWQALHLGCPACEVDADIIDRLRAYSTAIGGGPGVITNAIDEIDMLRLKVKAFEDWVSGIYCDFRGLVRGPDDDLHDWNWIDEHRPPPGLPVETEPHR